MSASEIVHWDRAVWSCATQPCSFYPGSCRGAGLQERI